MVYRWSIGLSAIVFLAIVNLVSDLIHGTILVVQFPSLRAEHVLQLVVVLVVLSRSLESVSKSLSLRPGFSTILMESPLCFTASLYFRLVASLRYGNLRITPS